jgi:putative oxidoreductase
MAHHGYGKLTNFSSIEPKFMEFLGLSKGVSLGLVVFAEFFCSLFLILGLFTRFALVPLAITMLVAAFKAHGGDIFGDGEMAFLYLAIYVSLLLKGAGKYSADALLFE